MKNARARIVAARSLFAVAHHLGLAGRLSSRRHQGESSIPTQIQSLCEQFLEEAAFLYAQALAYREDPELTWLDLHELDRRLEAQLDGLVVAGDRALDVVIGRAAEAEPEPGALYAGLRVLCRLGRIEAVETVLALILDSADDPEGVLPARRSAAAEALLLDCPRPWHERLVRTAQPRIGMLAPALVRDGTRAAPLLLEMLAGADDTDRPAILTALGKAGGPEAGPPVAAHVASEFPAVAAAAATACLRLGHAETYRYLLLAASVRPWLIVPLALGGGAGAVRVLLDLIAKGQVSDEALLG
jgi:hypothetical protein